VTDEEEAESVPRDRAPSRLRIVDLRRKEPRLSRFGVLMQLTKLSELAILCRTAQQVSYDQIQSPLDHCAGGGSVRG
jgi:hypothetical protein